MGSDKICLPWLELPTCGIADCNLVSQGVKYSWSDLNYRHCGLSYWFKSDQLHNNKIGWGDKCVAKKYNFDLTWTTDIADRHFGPSQINCNGHSFKYRRSWRRAELQTLGTSWQYLVISAFFVNVRKGNTPLPPTFASVHIWLTPPSPL